MVGCWEGGFWDVGWRKRSRVPMGEGGIGSLSWERVQIQNIKAEGAIQGSSQSGKEGGSPPFLGKISLMWS